MAVLPNGRISAVWGTVDAIGYAHVDARRFNSTATPLANSQRVIAGDIPPGDQNWFYNDPIRVLADASNNTWIISSTSDYGLYFVRKLNSQGTLTASFSIDLMAGYRKPPANNTETEWTLFYASPYIHFDVTPSGELIAGEEITGTRLVIDVGQRFEHRALVRRFSATGVRQNDILLANISNSGFYDHNPGFIRTANTPDGQLAVVWQNSSYNRVFRKYSLNGVATAAPRTLVTGTSFNNRLLASSNYDLEVLPDGRMILAWNETIGFDYDKNWVREFDANGVAIGLPALFESSTDKACDLERDGATNDYVFVTCSDYNPRSSATANIVVRKIRFGNAAPVLSGVAGDASYELAKSPVAINPTDVIKDGDSSHLGGHTLQALVSSGGHSSNLPSFIGASISQVGTSIRVEGVTIGTMLSGAGVGTSPLKVTSSSNATLARVQRLLRAMRFSTTSTAFQNNRIINVSVINVSVINVSVINVSVINSAGVASNILQTEMSIF